MTTQTKAPETRRLSINLSEKAYQQLQDLARESGRSMTDLVRTALGVVKIAYDEKEKDHRLVIASREGRPIREIVIPE